jgi:uncharacterized protein with HEPN domain
MSKHDIQITLLQLKGFAKEAIDLAKAHSREDLAADLGLRRHAERVVELMGEACNRLPKEFLEQHPEIPWRQIVSMRNWLAHGYDGVDYDILWDAVSRNASSLLEKIEPVIEELPATKKKFERDISDDL